jgi:1-deoxy-D-xylulose-5-phosphate reductoisomerase
MAQLNAANEVAVDAFLERRLGFTEIPELIENVLGRATSAEPTSLDVVKQADLQARELALELLADA